MQDALDRNISVNQSNTMEISESKYDVGEHMSVDISFVMVMILLASIVEIGGVYSSALKACEDDNWSDEDVKCKTE